MSFGSTFGGFGANNNNQQQQQQSTGFAGFGSANTTNNTTGGFGASGNTGFGATSNPSGGSLFGAANTAGTGFSGFGANNNNQQSSAFGQPRPFSSTATTGGSLFGGNTGTTSNTGFGGFGATANNTTANTTAPGFGSGSGGGLFGNQAQPSTGFGSSAGGGLFGASTQQSAGFGNNTSTGGFGAQAAAPAFGNNPPQNNGTGATPFAPHTEKDPNSAQSQQHYQSITCQPQYQNFQFEELRVVDYTQGRKYANQSGQAGAFGTPTAFGSGFGASNSANNAGTGFGASSGGGLFGNSQTQSQPFGSTPTSTGFGSTTGGGLFGAKPATSGGLFGSNTSTSGQTTGGMFGSAGGSGFGASNNTPGFGATSGGGLFGASQNNQPKPGGLFGNQPNTSNPFGASTTNTGFGASNTGGGLFGASNNQQNTTGGFGQPQPNQSGGLFGSTPNQNQTQNNATGGGLFGGLNNQNQPKPGGLFGTPPGSGTGLFGQSNQQQQPQQPSTGLFGANNNQNTQGGGLFGQPNQQPKPSLFGATQPANNTAGGGLFSNLNNQNNQGQGNSLFGGANQNQQKPNLFGAPNNNAGGGGLFGSLGPNTNNQQNTGSSLFGGNNQNQQPQLGSSLFGSTQQNQQSQQQPAQLTTSIMSNNPYGNEHLFVSLSTPTQNVGPLMTPLSSSQKARKPAPLPTYRLNPASSSRLLTPHKRSGYGFDYSSYGTPGSAYSSATPPMYARGLLGGGSFGRSLSKSLSTSNLRSAYSAEESILSPGAFSTGGMGSGSGNMKKLKINRSIRTDLFGADGPLDSSRASPLKKTVSFEANSTTGKDQQANGVASGLTNGQTSNALVRVEEPDSPTPSAEEQGYLRSSTRVQRQAEANGSAAQPTQPEMEQVKGNELAVVPEDATPTPEVVVPTRNPMAAEEIARLSQKDMEPGAYFMTPSKSQIEKMSRKDRSKIKHFVVGREHTGLIEFDQVDLSNVDLDKIMGDIVQITQRSATVYPNHANKPPLGKGLNFPARITLENSWPRSKGGKVPVFERKGPRFEKHLERLQRVSGTEFEQYVVDKGQWIFRVPHFSTYALDYSDDDENMFSPAPANMSINSSAFMSRLSAKSQMTHEDVSFSNGSSGRDSNVDDTFEFRTSRSLPGAFDEGIVSDEESYPIHESEEEPVSGSFSNSEMAQIQGNANNGLPNSSIFDGNLTMAGALNGGNLDGVIDDDSPQHHARKLVSPIKPKSILKASRQPGPGFGSPSLLYPAAGGDWASHLQRTLSPKKQNRQILRESQGIFMKDQRQQVDSGISAFNKEKNPFATSIDVMNSLFGQAKGARGGKQATEPKGFQYPYAKRNKLDPATDMTDADRAFHKSFKPSWAFDGTFIYSASGPAEDGTGPTARILFEGNDNEFGCFAAITPAEATNSLREQQSVSRIVMDEGCPRAQMTHGFDFNSLAESVRESDPASQHERLMWGLASVLFDSLSQDEVEQDRKTRLSDFWTKLVRPGMLEQSKTAGQGSKDQATLAIIQLSGHDIESAVASLVEDKNFRLGTMVAQIGGDETMRSGFNAQLEEWRRTNALSEISPPIRSLYELLAGNTCTATGKSGAGPENRADTFNISSRFGLDWRRAFGLKLWYGKLWDEETLADAIKAYVTDLAAFREEVKPLPWFLEQGFNTGWDDPRQDERQDILLGLLKIYALNFELDHEVGDDFLSSRVKLADIISPQNVSGNPTDARLSFQLYHALSAKELIDFPAEDRDHKADLLATDYAFQLSADPENLFDALFVILHLSDASAREAAVKALLDRHAGAIEDTEKGEVFSRLTTHLQIPEPWIWVAKALYAKAVLADERQECYCLLKAGDGYLVQAHNTLRRLLAPKCIIEEDMATLREVLEWFGHVGASSMKGWETGGGVYVDYVRLLELARHGDRKEVAQLVKKLGQVLVAMANRKLSLEERVAVTEMGNGIGKAVEQVEWRTGGIEATKRSQPLPKMPPVASNAALDKAIKLSEKYYSAVLVGGH